MMVRGDHIPGGHRTQLDQTCRYLQALEVDAVVSFEEWPDLSRYDLVHGFGLGPAEIRRCRQAGLPVVLSTIYWGRFHTSGQHQARKPLDVWKHRGRMGLVLLRSALQGQHMEKCEAFVEELQNQRVAYEMADLLLPNSEMEARTIQAELGVTTPYCVVPNAVDPAIFQISMEPPVERNHVLFAGRFEPHKNQLGLIEAMRSSDLPVIFVGHPHPDHPAYYEQCKRRATKNMTILPGVPHEQLAPLYTAAKVHVLPSWSETTGLVSLEAALCGCNIVTTERGYTREYFQDLAWYCNPADPHSIRRAIEDAYHTPFRAELKERVLDNFTWEHTARATLKGYKMLQRTELFAYSG